MAGKKSWKSTAGLREKNFLKLASGYFTDFKYYLHFSGIIFKFKWFKSFTYLPFSTKHCHDIHTKHSQWFFKDKKLQFSCLTFALIILLPFIALDYTYLPICYWLSLRVHYERNCKHLSKKFMYFYLIR